jgi:hypothetical protein
MCPFGSGYVRVFKGVHMHPVSVKTGDDCAVS